MKTLGQHNSESDARYQFLRDGLSKSGVACDLCGAEMLYENPGAMNMSNPPSHWVCCPKCNFRGLLKS